MARRVQKIRGRDICAAKKYDTITDGESRRLINEEIDRKKDTAKKPLDRETEDLLAEIDEVLESEAEEFVANYIQKGGE